MTGQGGRRPRQTIAVTGGRGFLGAAIVAACVARGHRVISIDVAPIAPVSGSDVAEVVADARDGTALEEVLVRNSVGTIVHAAAVAGVAAVRADLRRATDVNVVGSVSVLAAARTASVARVVDLSSEEIYGATDATDRIAEDAPLSPASAYGAHKLAVELLAREFTDVFEYAAARLSWVYGPGFPRERPPQPWLEAAAARRLSPTAAGGDHVADLLHVDDAAAAVVRMVEAVTLRHAAYNVGSGIGVPLGEVAALIGRLEPAWQIDLDGGTLDGVSIRAPLSTARIQEELGWSPSLSLEDGIRRTLHDLRHERLIRVPC